MKRNASRTNVVVPVWSGLRWSGWTDRGRVRPHNEDSFLGLRFNGQEVERLGKTGDSGMSDTDLVFAVSDGMGGAQAGEFASRIAVEKITTLLPREFRRPALETDAGLTAVLDGVFREIHRALAYLGGSYDECRGMETTLSLAWFSPGWMWHAHVGDSRIYHRPRGEAVLKQLTEDDTHVAWLLRTGQISAWEARMHPRRHVLQKALGGGNQFVNPQIGRVACGPGDRFLLCTDGLFQGLTEARMEEMISTPSTSPTRKRSAAFDPFSEFNRARTLVDASVREDGRDNTTALVVEIGD